MRKLRLLLLPLLLLAGAVTARGQSVYASRNFLVEAESPEVARRVAGRAEAARLRFGDVWLGYRPRNWLIPVPLVVTPHPAHDQPQGGFERRFGKNFLTIEVWGKDTAEAETFVDHEVGHAVIDREFESVPRWMHEGLCVAFEHLSGKTPDRYGPVVGRTPMGEFLRCPGVPPTVNNGNAFYNQGASVVLFVREKWGREAVWDLHRAARHVGWDLSVVTTLGVSVEEFEKMWTEALCQKSIGYP